MQIAIFALNDNLCSKGYLKELKHWMKLAKEKLISWGKQSAEFNNVPLLEFAIYFCNHHEGKLPPAIWESETI